LETEAVIQNQNQVNQVNDIYQSESQTFTEEDEMQQVYMKKKKGK
jgi:hypothetical protein